MLSSNDLNKFHDRSNFKNILKEKLPQKKFLKILNKSEYNNHQSELNQIQISIPLYLYILTEVLKSSDKWLMREVG